jgi:mRNA-degrading endonuclease RelE of RelBE toxin-antitoxin system
MKPKGRGRDPLPDQNGGEYRIECEIRDKVLVVLVLKVGHRREICRH